MSHDNILYLLLQVISIPPGLPIFLLLLALVFTRPKTRMFFLILGLGSLYLASIPAFSQWLRTRVEVYPPVSLEHTAAEAIVVLGADRRRDAPEYGGDTLGGLALERLRYAALLHKKSGLPLLVSGGLTGEEGRASEAELMRTILQEFGVATKWMDDKSLNTYENAQFSSRILKGAGIGEILLVTHALHMPRAVEAFEKSGMKVIPAPTGMMSPNREFDFRDWMPTASALQMNFYAMHELLGRAWYHLHYYRTAQD